VQGLVEESFAGEHQFKGKCPSRNFLIRMNQL